MVEMAEGEVVTDDRRAEEMKEIMESMWGLMSSQSRRGIWRYVRVGSGAEHVVHMFRTCDIFRYLLCCFGEP